MASGDDGAAQHTCGGMEGFSYREEFISSDEERDLLEQIALQPLTESRYREWAAKRRTVNFGGQYDFAHRQLHCAAPIPDFLHPLRARLARWVDAAAESFTQAGIAEYRPGTQLGWHRDVPDFELIAGVSLQGTARMRFRPHPPPVGRTRDSYHIDLRPRSAYIIRDTARWKWQHAISPTKELRYSITFRTPRPRPGN
jgi:alkylated DNA repair dioxygenase AlkB